MRLCVGRKMTLDEYPGDAIPSPANRIAPQANAERNVKEFSRHSNQNRKRRRAIVAKRVRKPLRKAERILIKMPNWLGDAVMSLPAIEYLRRLFPHARMMCLVKENIADLLRNNNGLDGVISYEHGSGVSALMRKAKTVRRLRPEFFDLAVLFTNSFESALWMVLARIPFRVGYETDGRSFLLTHGVSRKPFIGHQISDYLDLCKALGEADGSVSPTVRIPSRDQEWAEDFLRSLGCSKDDLLIGLCPGAAYGPAKRWLPGRFVDVSRRLAEDYPTRFAIFGGKGDLEPCEMVANGVGHSAINLCRKTSLKELAALLEKCALVISNDSGAMHLASAIGTHVIAIFGPTAPARTAPPENCIVFSKAVPCSPCFNRECPTDFRCMTSISADEVYQQASEVLLTQETGGLWRRKREWML